MNLLSKSYDDFIPYSELIVVNFLDLGRVQRCSNVQMFKLNLLITIAIWTLNLLNLFYLINVTFPLMIFCSPCTQVASR